MAPIIDDSHAVDERLPSLPKPAAGMMIDFGDPGVGIILAVNKNKILINSPVLTGWIEWRGLAAMLTANDPKSY